eukprot:TRINITY_DN21436_c0_g1_i1.p2 TRINITY_DN21436_c0_g1~~TRINITY_DN21436_c0_g1_i1.p2  ORF type:complete len:119 (+),score=18.56 TRINITY_DN21436_c0_g1_i1:2-358(+)
MSLLCLFLFVVSFFFFFSSRRRHTRCREVSWARRCVQETVLALFGQLTVSMTFDYLSLFSRPFFFWSFLLFFIPLVLSLPFIFLQFHLFLLNLALLFFSPYTFTYLYYFSSGTPCTLR